jgi:hypothetical protein
MSSDIIFGLEGVDNMFTQQSFAILSVPKNLLNLFICGCIETEKVH